MSNLKTQPTDTSIREFLRSITDDARRDDCLHVLDIMKSATGEEPKLWGTNMVGFGTYHYRYASGREGDWFLTGFSPRKADLTLYIMAGFERCESFHAGSPVSRAPTALDRATGALVRR